MLAQLRYLSVADVRISADRAMSEWRVELEPQSSYLSRAHALTQLCALLFRRSSGNHPLLTGALGGWRSPAPEQVLLGAANVGLSLDERFIKCRLKGLDFKI